MRRRDSTIPQFQSRLNQTADTGRLRVDQPLDLLNRPTGLPFEDRSTFNGDNRRSILAPLTTMEYTFLDWADPTDNANRTIGTFSYPGLVRINTIGDGSCLFHAIAKAYFRPYKMGLLNGVPISRTKFVRRLRRDLSILLGQRIEPDDPTSPLHYDTLSRGRLREFAEGLPAYRLENMQKLLDSDQPVDNAFNEFISNVLEIDIYLLDLETQDVYITGHDDEILYRDRPSVVILTMPGHYELVGLWMTGGSASGIQTFFPPDHPLIQAIRRRIRYLRSVRSKTS